MAQYLKALHPGGILLESKNITNDAIIISHGMDIKAAPETLDKIFIAPKIGSVHSFCLLQEEIWRTVLK